MPCVSYFVEEVYIKEGAVLVCSACEWTGDDSQTAEIEGCALSAGDPSPAGRCPECDSLVYVREEE